MNGAIIKLLDHYDTLSELQKIRSYSILPAEIFKYFLKTASSSTSNKKPDVLAFIQSTRDVFTRQDLYFAASIDGHGFSAVVRNVSAALKPSTGNTESCKKCHTGPNDDGSPDVMTSCILVIFDPATQQDERVLKPLSHLSILDAIKKYLLVEAQFNFGCDAYKSEEDIEVKVHALNLPSNNSKQGCLNYLETYLASTEECCRIVLFTNDSDDSFWKANDGSSMPQASDSQICAKIASISFCDNVPGSTGSHGLEHFSAASNQPDLSLLLPEGSLDTTFPPAYNLDQNIMIADTKTCQDTSLEMLRLPYDVASYNSGDEDSMASKALDASVVPQTFDDDFPFGCHWDGNAWRQ